MHIDISASGEAPCWVYFNENISGQCTVIAVEFKKYFAYVVEDYRTRLHVIPSNAPKLIRLQSPFIYFS